MSKRNCHPPHHESSHEQRLREIVDELVPDDSQKQAYLAFAHELTAVQRRAYTVHRVIPTKPIRQAQGRLRAGRNLARMPGRRDPSLLLGMTDERDPSTTLGVTRGRDPSTTLGVTGTTMRHRCFPDYSMGTKRIVAKWFARGLHGNLLWRVGEAILNRG